jgi:hypothetical protein
VTACDVLRAFYGVDEESAKEILSELTDTTSLERLTEPRANRATRGDTVPRSCRLVPVIAPFNERQSEHPVGNRSLVECAPTTEPKLFQEKEFYESPRS